MTAASHQLEAGARQEPKEGQPEDRDHDCGRDDPAQRIGAAKHRRHPRPLRRNRRAALRHRRADTAMDRRQSSRTDNAPMATLTMLAGRHDGRRPDRAATRTAAASPTSEPAAFRAPNGGRTDPPRCTRRRRIRTRSARSFSSPRSRAYLSQSNGASADPRTSRPARREHPEALRPFTTESRRGHDQAANIEGGTRSSPQPRKTSRRRSAGRFRPDHRTDDGDDPPPAADNDG